MWSRLSVSRKQKKKTNKKQKTEKQKTTKVIDHYPEIIYLSNLP